MSNVHNISGAAVKPSLFSDRGNWNAKAGFSKLEENIRMLLMTSKGTMIGDPNFGSNIYKILYGGNNTSTASRIRYEIAEVLEKYYPEITVNSIDIEFADNAVTMWIQYSVSRTNVTESMTLEFIRSDAS